MSYYGPASEPNLPRSMQYEYDNGCGNLYRGGHFHRLHKRLRKAVRIVPWRDEWEFQCVGKGLLSVLDDIDDDDQSAEESFAMIAVWKSRLSTSDGLPHAVESTASLAQIYWRDSRRRRKRRLGGMTASTTELRLSYAAAIVRCINGFADSLQQQRAMAASVSSLCEQIGIPTWLVDTRHESAHNILPSLEVLRLSASTLLEFMKSEYWIPKWNEWNRSIGNNKAPENSETEPADTTNDGLVEFLVQYKACASAWDTGRSMDANGNNSDSSPPNKRKKKTPLAAPPKTTILPYDPLFGELPNSSEDDEYEEEDEEYNDKVTNNKQETSLSLDKPVVNTSIYGTSVGTNTNRFILLDIFPTKKKKYKKKKSPKPIHNKPKKKKGEKSPTDCAKLFVHSSPSLQVGYAVAIQYLIYGGIGGAPKGRGVLIPGSENAFPATPQGVTKCWQRYSPLVHVICRSWLGFSSCMITNLVDFVLTIEDDGLDKTQHELYVGSTRKLYFLYAWIRLLLSQRFVAALDRKFAVQTSTSKKNANPMELPLAQLEYMETLGYPLNSLLDRCRRYNDPNNHNLDIGSGRTSTSQDIAWCLETILGTNAIKNFGYPDTAIPPDETQGIVEEESSWVPYGPEPIGNNTATGVEAKKSAGEMSLEEMEAMLLAGDNNDSCSNNEGVETERHPMTDTNVGEGTSKQHGPQYGPTIEDAPMDEAIPETHGPSQYPRPVWVRCERWDPCSIGTLPGYPS